MKTIFQYLLLTAACAALGACQDFSDDTAFTPETPELSFVETSITAEKATKDYELSIKSNLPWRIECDKDWVSFDPSYGQGDATITVTVAANRTLDERTATISAYVIKGENVTLPVTQAAASASDLATHYYVKTDGSADKDGLTWETATTLANAIDQAMNGDVIHVAAGSYVPSVPLTGMKTALDNTFEIHSNFSMIGGYPADAAEGAVADPVANETILDGDHAVCHVVAVTAAKMNGMKASLDGFTIKNGSSQFSTVGSTTIGGVKFYQSYGAGIFIGNATVDILNCKIVDNTDIRMGAIRVDAGAEALFDNCVVADNATKSTTTYNCGGLWADGAKLLRINNCTFSNNKASGVAPCIYVFGDTGGKTNVLISNTTISGNSVNPEHATLNGGGIYVRENGNLVIVNSTVCGNHSGKGGGIAVYGKGGQAEQGGDRQLYDCRQHDGDGRKRCGIAAGCRRRGHRGLQYADLGQYDGRRGRRCRLVQGRQLQGRQLHYRRHGLQCRRYGCRRRGVRSCLDAQPAGRQRRCDEDLRAARRRESGAPVRHVRFGAEDPGRDARSGLRRGGQRHRPDRRFAHGQDGDRSRREINLFTGACFHRWRPFFCIFGVVTPLLSVAASGPPPPQGGAVCIGPTFL